MRKAFVCGSLRPLRFHATMTDRKPFLGSLALKTDREERKWIIKFISSMR